MLNHCEMTLYQQVFLLVYYFSFLYQGSWTEFSFYLRHSYVLWNTLLFFKQKLIRVICGPWWLSLIWSSLHKPVGRSEALLIYHVSFKLNQVKKN